ncbi:MAG: hypothetical protein JWO19_105 [Bryobacterales bacterium]|nr:hypothetical protein [Bryobacterales bacterium]
MKFRKLLPAVATLILAVVVAALISHPIGAQPNTPAGAVQGSAPVSIVNQPIGVNGTVTVSNLGSTTLPVSVTNFPATQNVGVTNFPATQNVGVTNFPATQTVSGTVNIGTLPSLQAVLTNAPGSFPFSGSLTSSVPQFAVPTTIGGQSVRALAVTELSGFCTGIGSFNLGLQDVSGGAPIATFSFRVGTLEAGVFSLLAQQTHILVAAGHSVGINDNFAPHGCRMDLSGYYITQ